MRFKRKCFLWDILFIVLSWIFYLFLNGYQFGISNQSSAIPFIEKTKDKNLFLGDILFTVPHNNTFFYSFYGFFSRFINLEWLYFLSYLLFSLLFFIAVFYLARTIFQKRIIAYFSLFLTIIPLATIAGDNLFFNIFLYNSISTPLIIFSLALFLRKKFILSAIVLAITFNFHSLPVIYLFGFLMTIIVFNQRLLQPKEKKKLLSALILFVILSLPLIIFQGLTKDSVFSQVGGNWFEIMRVRSGHHSFPSSFWPEILSFGPILLLTGFSLLKINQIEKNGKNNFIIRSLTIIFLIFILYCLLGTIFTEVWPIRLITLLQLFRSSVIITILSLILISWLVNYFIEQKSNTLLKFLNLILASLIIISFFIKNLILIFYLLPLLTITLLNKNNRNKTEYSFIVTSWLFFLLSLIFFKKYFFLEKGVLFFTGLGLLTFFLALIFYLAIQKNSNKYTSLIIIACLVLFILRLNNPDFFRDKKASFLSLYLKNKMNVPWDDYSFSSWIEVQKWARNNTKKDDLFLTPPGKEGFRIFSQRPIVSDWKDGTFSAWSEDFAQEWYQRMEEMDIKNPKDFGNFFNLETNRIDILRQKYNFDYLVTKNKKLPYNKIYENAEFIIYNF